jgi:hypothetical protein
LGPKRNWKYDLLNLINEKFHSKATEIIFIWTYKIKLYFF